MSQRVRCWTAAAGAVLALATTPGVVTTIQPTGVARADVCVNAGRRVSVSGCANLADVMAPYVPPPTPDPEVLARIDYAAHRAIQYNLADALYGPGTGPYPVTFMTTSQLFRKSVAMYAVPDGEARERLFRRAEFRHTPCGRALPAREGPRAGSRGGR